MINGRVNINVSIPCRLHVIGINPEGTVEHHTREIVLRPGHTSFISAVADLGFRRAAIIRPGIRRVQTMGITFCETRPVLPRYATISVTGRLHLSLRPINMANATHFAIDPATEGPCRRIDPPIRSAGREVVLS